MSARTFIDKAGRDTIATVMGVSDKSVSAAYSADSFPASWFDQLDKLAKKKRIKLPRDAFNWREAVA